MKCRTKKYLMRAIIGIMTIFMLVGTVQADEIRVKAYIDGRSQLIINEDAQWHHLDWAAPGRWDGQTLPTYITPDSGFGEHTWYPEWPDVPDPENRDCNCYSSKLSLADPILPPGSTFDYLEKINARNTVSIIQEPNAGNGYTLIADFNDGDWGADWYDIKIHYTPPNKPDLVVTGISAPIVSSPGIAFMIGWTVKNVGDANAVGGNWIDHIYLSSDSNIDGSDILLEGPIITNPLVPDDSYTLGKVITIPDNIVLGDYNIIVKTDFYDSVAEYNEDNNILTKRITITGPGEPVPEIPTILMASIGLLGLIYIGYKKR